ncbi:type II toxin-antitoxin system Phd/YefM family antitoxin [Pricia sp.]|uniref:type II toxin-antitoxin system Phd/YefM family antitoxin n=1 Tax=Pricia sp. TaxID=2268138 RepID=UPI0035947598
MLAANFTEFRTELKNYLDNVEDNNETLIIKRKTGKGTVVISLDEYNSMMETVHLLSSKANADRLFESIQQMKSGEKVEKDLKDLQK